jgi:hypothetical protein
MRIANGVKQRQPTTRDSLTVLASAFGEIR